MIFGHFGKYNAKKTMSEIIAPIGHPFVAGVMTSNTPRRTANIDVSSVSKNVSGTQKMTVTVKNVPEIFFESAESKVNPAKRYPCVSRVTGINVTKSAANIMHILSPEKFLLQIVVKLLLQILFAQK